MQNKESNRSQMEMLFFSLFLSVFLSVSKFPLCFNLFPRFNLSPQGNTDLQGRMGELVCRDLGLVLERKSDVI